MKKVFKQCTTRLLSNGNIEITEYGENTGEVETKEYIFYNEEWNRSTSI